MLFRSVVITFQGTPLGPIKAGTCPKYSLFPFSADQKNQALEGITLQLQLEYQDEFRDDVETAVWAWTNFGGLGSRTRRGCGALYCRETAPHGLSKPVLLDWWNSIQVRCGVGVSATYPEWSQVNRFLFVNPSSKTPLHAWETILGQLAEFRQGIPFAREAGPARSKWPEADSLRGYTKDGVTAHMGTKTLPNPGEQPGFPRAMLGLPIVFHFRDQADQSSNGGTLEPLGSERMASGIILRPLKASNGEVAGIALPLLVPAPNGLRFRFTGDQRRAPWTIPGGQTAFIRPDFASYRDSPLAGLTKSGNSSAGFLNFVKGRKMVAIAATKGV